MKIDDNLYGQNQYKGEKKLNCLRLDFHLIWILNRMKNICPATSRFILTLFLISFDSMMLKDLLILKSSLLSTTVFLYQQQIESLMCVWLLVYTIYSRV